MTSVAAFALSVERRGVDGEAEAFPDVFPESDSILHSLATCQSWVMKKVEFIFSFVFLRLEYAEYESMAYGDIW